IDFDKKTLSAVRDTISLVNTTTADRIDGFGMKRLPCDSLNLLRYFRPWTHFPVLVWWSQVVYRSADSQSFARAIALRTCCGAVPPIWFLLSSDPSSVSTEKISCSIC